MTYETIAVATDGAVRIITLNRPEALNALSSKVLEDLRHALQEFDKDDALGCAVLTGAGDKAFAAGADIKEMVSKDAADFYLEDFFSGWTDDITARIRKPWIAAVNGFALGGGCELAMMADFIIASEKARFGQPEITLGVGPGMGGSQRLTRAVGKAKAMEMVLTGRMMGAVEAEKCGLVAHIVPHDELMAKTMETAHRIASMPRMAAMVNKEMINAVFDTTLAQGLIHERRLFQILTATEDMTEGMRAFAEKREPKWKGR